MTYVTQTEWGWLIAAYLFLGGLGGSTAAVVYWGGRAARLSEGTRRKLMRYGFVSGLVAVGAGMLFLLADLVNPWHLEYLLRNPSSWIFWGSVLLMLYMVLVVVYLFGDLRPGGHPVGSLAGAAGVVGLLVALYTGFLVSQAPAIAFWNTPALPLLFLISAASTAAALVMLYVPVRVKDAVESARLLGLMRRVDVALIGAELVVLLAYFNYFRVSAKAGRISAHLLLTSPGFLIGFGLIGLIAPWAAEIWELHQSAMLGVGPGAMARHGHALSVVSAFLILVGGLLLRHYVLSAGVFGYPFPNLR